MTNTAGRWFLALGASAAVMALSGSIPLFVVWLLICCFPIYYLRQPGAFAPLAFWLAFNFFYPDTALAFTSLQEHRSVKGTILFVYLAGGFSTLWLALQGRRWLKTVVGSWIAWGVCLYLVVFFAWLFGTVLKLELPGFMEDTVHSTSALKLAVPVIAAVGAIIPALYSVRQPRDIPVLFSAIAAMTFLLIVLSYIELFTGTRFVESDYEAIGGRLVAFSSPDPNSYGRLLLVPILFMMSALFTRRNEGASTWWRWGLILLAIVTVLLTLSRTTYLSLSAGFLILLLLNMRGGRSVPVAMLLLVTVATAINATDIGREFVYGTERGSFNSLETRMLLYESIQQIIVDSPIVGALPGGYFEALTAVGYTSRLVSAHNMFLGVAVEWGLPMAALLLVALLGSAGLALKGLAALSLRQPDTQTLAMLYRAIIATAAAYLVHGVTEIVPPDAVFFLVGLALAGHLMAPRTTVHPQSVPAQRRGARLQSPSGAFRSVRSSQANV